MGLDQECSIRAATDIHPRAAATSRYMGSSINDVMPEGGRGGSVSMTNNVEGCMKKHDGGGGVKNAQK